MISHYYSTKFCKSCLETLSLKQFYLLTNRKSGRQWYSRFCRACENAKSSDRSARLRKQTPAWANRKEIRRVYQEAKLLSRRTGEKMSVDHIIPIKGKYVCGLHVEYNLRIITKLQNSIKHNNVYEDIEYVPVKTQREKRAELRRALDDKLEQFRIRQNTGEAWQLSTMAKSRLDAARKEIGAKNDRKELEEKQKKLNEDWNRVHYPVR